MYTEIYDLFGHDAIRIPCTLGIYYNRNTIFTFSEENLRGPWQISRVLFVVVGSFFSASCFSFVHILLSIG